LLKPHIHHDSFQCRLDYPPRIIFIGGGARCHLFLIMASAIIIDDISWTTIVIVVSPVVVAKDTVV
jgi:hypothetical protein